jgi:hypothetical protein
MNNSSRDLRQSLLDASPDAGSWRIKKQYTLCRSFAEPVLLTDTEFADVKQRCTTHGRQDALTA